MSDEATFMFADLAGFTAVTEVHGDEPAAARGSQRFKNVGEPIMLHAAASDDPSAKREWPIDPVCRMAVDPKRRAGVVTHADREFSFCSMNCIRAFAETPERYAEMGAN